MQVSLNLTPKQLLATYTVLSLLQDRADEDSNSKTIIPNPTKASKKESDISYKTVKRTIPKVLQQLKEQL